MAFLLAIWRFYLNASVQVAFGVSALYLLSCKMLTVAEDWNMALLLFFATPVSYNFIKYGVEARKYILPTKRYHVYIQIFSVFCAIAALYYFWNLEWRFQSVIFFLGVLSLGYVIPLLPHAKQFRAVAGIKMYIVALVWAGCTALIPLMQVGLEWSIWEWMFLFQRFILVVILLIPFEIRDLKFDPPSLRTLPQLVGIKKSKYLGYLLCLLYLILILANRKLGIPIHFPFIWTAILILAIYLTEKENNEFYASFWVEAIPVMMLATFWFTY